jgi:hypothetical protein
MSSRGSRQRERERDSETERQRDRETERDREQEALAQVAIFTHGAPQASACGMPSSFFSAGAVSGPAISSNAV